MRGRPYRKTALCGLVAGLALVVTLLLTTSVTLAAQPKNADPAFLKFWSNFRTAIVKNDKETVVSMTKLPFLFDNQERSRSEFLKIYDQLFTRKVKRCFATAKPLREGDNYDVFCAGLIFYFGKVDGEYKLLEFGVDD
jgi:hypothetical protein